MDDIIKVLKNKDELLSNELRKYIKNVNIDVFIDNEEVMLSKDILECKTLLGVESYSDLYGACERANSIFIRVFKFIFAGVKLYMFLVLMYYIGSSKLKGKFILNDDNTYFAVNIKYIPIFINEKLINILDHEELISVCLSTVFSHSQAIREMIKTMNVKTNFMYGANVLLLLISYPFLLNANWSKTNLEIIKNGYIKYEIGSDEYKYKVVPEPGSFSHKLFYKLISEPKTYTPLIIASYICVSYLINRILYVDKDFRSDEYLIKLGRAESLISAYKKIKIEYDKNTSKFFEIFKISMKFLGFHSSRTSMETRIKNLENKNNDEINSKVENVNNKFMNIINKFII